MSLGALDFGIIVDGAVVIVENCVRRLAHAQHAAWAALLTRDERFARGRSRRARRRAGRCCSAQLIIMVVYLPIFALTGRRGEDVPPDGVHGRRSRCSAR